MTGHAAIDSVEAGSSGGRIGMTPCPGIGGFPFPSDGLEDRLATDFAAIREFSPRALVTLMQAGELERAGLSPSRLEDRALALGLAWHHLPIADYGIPDEAFEVLWTEAGGLLRAELERGERIVLHCWAGLGRTGVIAARLLVEMGEDAEQAVSRVRAARPGTIQTQLQLAHVKDREALLRSRR